MTDQLPTSRAIFLAALESSRRRADMRISTKPALGTAAYAQHVELLLDAHAEGTGACSIVPAAPDRPTIDQPPLEHPGTQIGPYKLLEQIGEGGMGMVYVAEQSEPVKRQVALKIIKPGMDTPAGDRPLRGRAAGAGDDGPPEHRQGARRAARRDAGRPYFVMELVKGVPITQYCDAAPSDPAQRLELFVPVCQAIQHAHQKGIIHRDLKPSNVLVALYDDQPVPKVIDFGVAKATGQQLTEQTLYTGFGTVVGTLEYMSPEQADVQPARRRYPQRRLFAGRAAVRAA